MYMYGDSKIFVIFPIWKTGQLTNLPNSFLLLNMICWPLDISHTAPYEITLVRQSICLSVCLSVTKFFQDCIISFSGIVHDDSRS